MTQTMLDELAARRAAAPDLDWDTAEAGVRRSYELLRPGGMLGLILPDGKPFIARKEVPQ
jgi:hypothetical protein